ncbi:MAG: GFA family protein [Myxococcota bacterium]
METDAHTPAANPHRHLGSCHCGAVRYAVDVDLSRGGTRCNCSVCTKTMTTGAIVKPDALVVLAGEGELSSYVWGHKVSARYFCKHCGVHVFGRGHLAELGGDFASINLNTLDDIDVGQLPLGHWDGRHNNWQAGLRPAPWPIA